MNKVEFETKLKLLYDELALYEDYNCYVNICTDVLENDADLLQIADYYGVDNEDIFVIYDDISLPLGKIRIRKKGSKKLPFFTPF